MVALRGDTSSRNNNTLYVDAVLRTTLQSNSGYLDYVFLGLPEYGINPNEYHRVADQYVNVADKVRMWMEHNTCWESCVVGAISSGSWTHEDNPLVRKVTVSQTDLSPSPFSLGPMDCKFSVSTETNIASLVQERGNLLVGVADDDLSSRNFYSLYDISGLMEYLSTERKMGLVMLIFILRMLGMFCSTILYSS